MTALQESTDRPQRSGRRRALPVLALFASIVLALAAAGGGRADAADGPALSCRNGESLIPRLRADNRLAAIEAEAAKVPHGVGRFYRLERDGQAPSFLFGTMHLSDPRILALPARIEAAFREATQVVIETLDVLDENAANFLVLAHPELMNLAPGTTLDDYLSGDEKRELEALLAAEGVPYASIRTLQPWFYALGLMLPACEAARAAKGARPLDVRLALDAEAAGKTVVGLETSLEQLRVLASMPMSLQTESLIEVLRVLDQVPDLFETMIEFYLAGNIAAITPLSETLIPVGRLRPETRAAYEAFENRIINERNRRMAERLAPLLARGGAFVAVGALHLPGEEGLVELLAKQGYRVSRID